MNKRKTVIIAIASIMFIFFIFNCLNNLNNRFEVDYKSLKEKKQVEHKYTELNLNTSGEFNFVHIYGWSGFETWEYAKSTGVCTGFGSSIEPYIIANHLFYTITGIDNLLSIYHSNVHFKIINCTFLAYDHSDYYGLYLRNVTNGLIINCTFYGFGSFDEFDYGIMMRNCSNNIFFNNTIYKCGIGIYLQEYNYNNYFINNSIFYCDGEGIRCNYGNNNHFIGNNITIVDRGILFYLSNNSVILGNTISNCEYEAILTGYCEFNNFSQNNINHNKNSGLFLLNCSNDIVLENNFTNNRKDGIFLDGSNSTTISGNDISNNTGSGIILWNNCFSNNISRNQIYNNSYHGIYFISSDLNNITNNYLVDNYFGNIIINKSSYILISGNNIFENKISNTGIILENCSNSLIIGNSLAYHKQNGLVLIQTNLTIISENNITYNKNSGIVLWNNCNFNNISRNNINYNNYTGIDLVNCSSNRIMSNNITRNKEIGILLERCNLTIISENIIVKSYDAITIYYSKNIIVNNNNMTECGLAIFGALHEVNSYNIDITNLVNYKLLYYYANQTNLRHWNFTDAGQIILVNCNSSIVSNIELSHNSIGIALLYCYNNEISYNNISNNSNIARGGILLSYSDNNQIFNNIFINNYFGIALINSSDFNSLANNQYINNIITYYQDSSCIGNQFGVSNYQNPSQTDDDEDSIKNEFLSEEEIATIVIASTIAGSAGVATIAAGYYFYGSKRVAKLIQKGGKNTTKKFKKKKKLKKISNKTGVSIRSFNEILIEISNKKELLKLFEETNLIEQISHLSNKYLTIVSNDFIHKVDQLALSDALKTEFLKEMLAFSPFERAIITDEVLKSMIIYPVPPVKPEKDDQKAVEYILEFEEYTLELIQEYLEKNRQFEAHKLIPFLSSRFTKASIDINVNGIKHILKSLIEKNILVEGSKLVREEILQNSNRKDIYEFIQKNPGIHFNKLFRELDLSNAVVRWHVSILIKFGFIRREIIENHDAYYDLEIDQEYSELLHLISREKYYNLIEYLRENDYGISKTKLSKELGMHINTVDKYLEKLKEFELIKVERVSNNELFFLNQDLYDMLKEKIVNDE